MYQVRTYKDKEYFESVLSDITDIEKAALLEVLDHLEIVDSSLPDRVGELERELDEVINENNDLEYDNTRLIHERDAAENKLDGILNALKKFSI